MNMTSLLPHKLVNQTKRLVAIASLSLLTLNVSAYDISINGSEYLELTAILDSGGAPTTSLMEYDHDSIPATVSFHVTDPLVCASKTASTASNIVTQIQDGNGIEVTTMQNNITNTEYDLDNDQFDITTDDTIACATIADAANNNSVVPNPDVIFKNGFESGAFTLNDDIQLTLLKVVDSNTIPMTTEPFPSTPISVSNSQTVEYQYTILNNSQVGNANRTVDFVEYYSLIAINGPIFDDIQDWTCTVPIGSDAATTCGTFSIGSETVRLDNAVIASGDSLIIYAKRQALVDATDIANNLKLDMLASAFVVDAGVTDSYLDNNTTYQQFGSSLVTATQLVMTGQPNSTAVSGSSLGSIIVEFQDNAGIVDASNTSSVTIAFQNNPSSGTLGGTVTKAAVNGIATFSDLNVDLVGTGYTLVANGGGFTSAVSNGVDITPAAASQLAIITQPSDTVAGGTINPVTIQLKDLNGNLVANNSDTVFVGIKLGTGTVGAIITGTQAIIFNGGSATFNSLSINLVGNSYQLHFTAPNILPAVSTSDSISFDITAVPVAANSEYGVSASSETAGTDVTYSAIIKDATGATVGAGIVVTFAMTNTSGANTADVNCTTDNTGTCSVNANSTLVGSTSVAASINGDNIATVSAGLSSSTTWVAGAADVANSSFGVSTNSEFVGTDVTYSAVVKDVNGNLVQDGQIVFFDLTDSNGASTLNFVSCLTSGGTGACFVTVTSSTTGDTLVQGAIAFPITASSEITTVGSGLFNTTNWHN